MSFKNYLKIAFSNFDKMWKQLFYRIIVWAVIIALLAPFYSVIKNIVLANWNFDLFKEFAGAGLFYGKNVAITFAAVADVLISALSTLFVQYTAVGVYFALILFIVKPFLMNIGRYVISELMYGFMSSHTKHGFCSSLVRTLKKSLPYSILRTFFCLPFNAFCTASFYFLLQVNLGASFTIAMPFIFLVLGMIVLSIKQVLIMGWAPAMVVSGENVFRSFGIGLKASLRGFGGSAIFSLSAYFAFILLSFGFGVFSLVIIVPLCAIITSVFEMMNFFSCQGMRYYADKDTVLSSKKLEEQDRITKAKFLL